MLDAIYGVLVTHRCAAVDVPFAAGDERDYGYRADDDELMFVVIGGGLLGFWLSSLGGGLSVCLGLGLGFCFSLRSCISRGGSFLGRSFSCSHGCCLFSDSSSGLCGGRLLGSH